ncbi:MAG: hypothetical protein ACPK85_11935 [Methanosarcina sp.]
MGNDKEFDKDFGESTGRDHGYGYMGYELFGGTKPPKPMEKYKCPNCGEIVADDTSLKDIGNGIEGRVCNRCDRSVKKLYKTR